MKFKVGDIANGVKTSEETTEFKHYAEALESVLERANLYCEPADEDAEKHINQLRDFRTHP